MKYSEQLAQCELIKPDARNTIWQAKLHLQTFHEEVPVNSAKCHEHCCFSIFQYYIHEELSNVVILATCQVTKIAWNAFVINKTQQCYFQYLDDLNGLPYWVTRTDSCQPSMYYTIVFLFKRLSNSIDDITPVI
jgi:hypothetical protein